MYLIEYLEIDPDTQLGMIDCVYFIILQTNFFSYSKVQIVLTKSNGHP